MWESKEKILGQKNNVKVFTVDQGCTGKPFFASGGAGRGRGKKIWGGPGRGGVTVKLRVFSGWGEDKV